MTSLPSFSLGSSRKSFDDAVMLIGNSLASQGISNASTLAAMAVTLKQQGLSNSEIIKQIDVQVANDKAKAAAKAAEVAKLQAAQKPLLDEIAAKTKAAQAASDVPKNLGNTKAPSVEMLANPLDPRGALITRAKYDEIVANLSKQGKAPHITGDNTTEATRALIEAQKNKTTVKTVIDANVTTVLFSDGTSQDRTAYKGEIPAAILAKITTKPSTVKESHFPSSYNSQTDIKTTATAPSDPTKTNVSASAKQDPTKTGSARSKSVFAPPEGGLPADQTLGGFIDAAAKATAEALGLGEKKDTTQTTKPNETPFDPLKAITDGINNAGKAILDTITGAGKTVTDAAAAAQKAAADAVAAVTTPPKPQTPPQEKPNASDKQDPSKTQPTPNPQPKDVTDPLPPKTTTLEKITKFAKDNSTAIVVGFAAVSFMGALAFTIPRARKGIMEKR